MVESKGSPNLNMIKYFNPFTREEWAKEVSIVSEIAKEIEEEEHPNILAYRWHSSGIYNKLYMNIDLTLFVEYGQNQNQPRGYLMHLKIINTTINIA